KHIYLDAIACRICCRLDYASRHLHRSVPGVHRVMRWWRMIGVDPHPFAAIPKRPRHHTRFHRIVARIRATESKLVGHLGGITRDLERRAHELGSLCETSWLADRRDCCWPNLSQRFFDSYQNNYERGDSRYAQAQSPQQIICASPAAAAFGMGRAGPLSQTNDRPRPG